MALNEQDIHDVNASGSLIVFRNPKRKHAAKRRAVARPEKVVKAKPKTSGNKNNTRRPDKPRTVPQTTQTTMMSGECDAVTVSTNSRNPTVMQPDGCEGSPTKIIILPRTKKPQ